MTRRADQGTETTVTTTSPDAEQALAAIHAADTDTPAAVIAAFALTAEVGEADDHTAPGTAQTSGGN